MLTVLLSGRPADSLCAPFWATLAAARGLRGDALVTCTSLCVFISPELCPLAFTESFSRLMGELEAADVALGGELRAVAAELLGLGPNDRLSPWQWRTFRSACVALGLGVFLKAGSEPRLLSMMAGGADVWGFDYLGAFDAAFRRMN